MCKCPISWVAVGTAWAKASSSPLISFLMVIWSGFCCQQEPLVTQSPYTGTLEEEGLR